MEKTYKVSNLTENDCKLLDIEYNIELNINENILIEFYDIALFYNDLELATKLIKNYNGNKIEIWK